MTRVQLTIHDVNAIAAFTRFLQVNAMDGVLTEWLPYATGGQPPPAPTDTFHAHGPVTWDGRGPHQPPIPEAPHR